MKKILLVLTLTLGTLVSNAQSIGTFYGSTGSAINTPTWGAWISTEKVGFEYSYSVSVNNDIHNTNSYKDKYLTQTSNSYGLTYIFETSVPHLTCIPSIGIQYTYSTFDKEIYKKSWTKDTYPYVSISGEYDLNSALNLRVRMQLGKVSSIGAGIGIRLGKY